MILTSLRRCACSAAIVLILGLITPAVCFALNLSTAVNRTLASSPQLQLYPHYIRALDGQAVQAGLKPNPNLTVDLENAFGTGDNRFLSGYELTLSLSQVIELAGKPEKRVNVVDQQSAALQQEYAVTRLDIVAAMLRDYYAALRLQYLLQWNRQRIDAEQKALAVIERRARAGVVGQADVMRMQLRLTRSQAKQQQLQATHQQALITLAAHWLAAPDFDEVEGQLERLPALPDTQRLTQAVAQTPDYLLADAQTRINQARLSLAQAQSKADITVGAGIRRQQANDGNAFVFSFSMPLQWHDRNQGNITSAQANYQAKLANQQLLHSQLELASKRIHSALANNLTQLERLNKALRPVATALLSEVKRGYQLGQYSVLQWVDAQNELFTIERERIEAQHAIHLQFLELERLSGSDLSSTASDSSTSKE